MQSHELLPNCLCGAHDYVGGGANVGPTLCQVDFRCTKCSRQVSTLQGFRVPTHVFFPVEPHASIDHDYLNRILLTTWRAHEEAHRVKRGEVYCEALERLGLKKGEDFYSFPEDKQAELLKVMDEFDRHPPIEPPLPPKLPKTMRVFYQKDANWVEVNHEESAKLEVPKDPIAIRHEAYWKDVFKSLKQKFGELYEQPIPNRYYNDEGNLEPWFHFTWKHIDFVVGPRKRVDSIQVESNKALRVRKIANAAKADQVSYWANGSWHGFDHPFASTLEVHAGSKEKVIEYISTIIEENASGGL